MKIKALSAYIYFQFVFSPHLQQINKSRPDDAQKYPIIDSRYYLK